MTIARSCNTVPILLFWHFFETDKALFWWYLFTTGIFYFLLCKLKSPKILKKMFFL
ncbi:unnamed protein product [Staurois parvus]|uniref:ATP synthase F0 subunit 8 n=1 Tax=Staurois parvus TaxID=386267 RepID=A0ABN9CEW3_9NEOB|nr:unnamed protein product [Staurois parvus]